MVDIGVEGYDGEAYDINNKGEAVGYIGAAPFIWDKVNGLRLLPRYPWPGGWDSAVADSINEMDAVVGYAYDTMHSPALLPTALIWQNGEGFYLDNLIDQCGNGLRAHCWTAKDINDKGQIALAASISTSDDPPSAIWGHAIMLNPRGPAIYRATSLKVHGNAGEFGIPLSLDPDAERSIEPRYPGPTKVVFEFDVPVKANDGSLDIGDEVCTNIPGDNIVGLDLDGRFLTVWLNRAVNNSNFRIDIEDGPDGITDLYGNPLRADRPTYVIIRSILGEVVGGPPVTIMDLGLIKSQLNKPVTENNFRCDINADGIITIFDLGLAKSNLMQPFPN